MQEFINAIRNAVLNENWYAALAIALTIPDICGRLEHPELGSNKRYVDWYNRYLLIKYSRHNGARLNVFLTGEDCYALRCAYLHQGEDEITEQRARKALDGFHFVKPRNGWKVHLNQSNTVLQLQVDIFCEDICAAVEKWTVEVVSNNQEVKNRLKGLLTIHSLDNGLSF